MPHLGIFAAPAPIFGDCFDQMGIPVLIKLPIVLFHQLCSIKGGLL